MHPPATPASVPRAQHSRPAPPRPACPPCPGCCLRTAARQRCAAPFSTPSKRPRSSAAAQHSVSWRWRRARRCGSAAGGSTQGDAGDWAVWEGPRCADMRCAAPPRRRPQDDLFRQALAANHASYRSILASLQLAPAAQRGGQPRVPLRLYVRTDAGGGCCGAGRGSRTRDSGGAAGWGKLSRLRSAEN